MTARRLVLLAILAGAAIALAERGLATFAGGFWP